MSQELTTAPIPRVRIKPPVGWSSLNLGEVWEFRDVLWMLALRDVKLRYKQTALGIIWVVLQPLLSGLIFSTIFGNFARLPSGGQPYLLFVFSGLLGWNLFSGILHRAGNSLVAEARLITKVYFPRLLLPCACAAAAMVDFLVSLLVMFGLLCWFGLWPGWSLLFLPLVVVLTLIFALGMSFWISALNVRYRDFTYALPFLVQVWMYASPVVYGLELVPAKWRVYFGLNPMTGLLEGFRQCLLGTSLCSVPLFILAVGATGFIFISGAFFFRRVEQKFADDL